MKYRKRESTTTTEITPEEILLDARNLPSYNAGRLEGRINKPIAPMALRPLVVLLLLVALVMFGRSAQLMALSGEHYRELSERNRLGHLPIFAERGVVYDRHGTTLAWNIPHLEEGVFEEYNERTYATTSGIGHLLGYVRLPARDTSGNLYREDSEGVAGVELAYNDTLTGTPGKKIVETDARMIRVSEGVVEPAVPGSPLLLTIDARLEETLYTFIGKLAKKTPFRGGAAVVMDIHTGEIVAMTSYPEYSPTAFAQGDSERIASYSTDERTPYLNRVISGQYTPGSIVKPYMAMAALTEGIVRPETTFVSTGALRMANPYSPGVYSTFTDWRAHGVVDLKRALAVSSNVYFYYIGGGFGEQEGLGIARIERYMKLFGFSAPTGITLSGEKFGVIPSPAWKESTFPTDPVWRIGDTYHTAIGQYGFQVTPLQIVRAVAALANDGMLLTPRIENTYTQYGIRRIDLPYEHFETVRAGMRDAVLSGTAAGLNVPYVNVAAKTGTAEIGRGKDFVHSWVMGFFPYEEPRYAFTVVMEHGPRKNLIGATYIMRQFLDWMHEHTPEYLETTA